jgi:hypothetical protein
VAALIHSMVVSLGQWRGSKEAREAANGEMGTQDMAAGQGMVPTGRPGEWC